MKKISQLEQVQTHFRQFGDITSWEAIQLYRITRLSAIIFILRDDGWNIESIRKENESKNWVKYVWHRPTYQEQLKFRL